MFYSTLLCLLFAGLAGALPLSPSSLVKRFGQTLTAQWQCEGEDGAAYFMCLNLWGQATGKAIFSSLPIHIWEPSISCSCVTLTSISDIGLPNCPADERDRQQRRLDDFLELDRRSGLCEVL